MEFLFQITWDTYTHKTLIILTCIFHHYTYLTDVFTYTHIFQANVFQKHRPPPKFCIFPALAICLAHCNFLSIKGDLQICNNLQNLILNCL
jgi:hypothetical protein